MSSIDPRYFENQFETLQETNWGLSQLFRSFNESWADTQLYWNDKAAAYIRERYIQLIQEDDENLKSLLEQHAGCIRKAIIHFYRIQETTEIAHQHSSDAEVFTSSSHQDLVSADHAINAAQENNQQSLKNLNAVHQSLKTAQSYVSPM